VLMSCCAPTIDGTSEMSAAKLLQLEAPNPDQVNSSAMTDLMSAAFASYPKDWVDDLNLQDLVKDFQVPPHMEDLVKDDDVRQALQSIVTAQISSSFWDGSTEEYWKPISSQQELKDRTHYFLQGMADTCMVSMKGYSKAFDFLRDHYQAKLMPDLTPYLAGEGGKSDVEWARDVCQYVFEDRDTLNHFLTAEPSTSGIHKLCSTISALTASSSAEKDRKLSTSFSNAVMRAFLNWCREHVGSLTEIEDIIKRVTHAVWDMISSEEFAKYPDIVMVLRKYFEVFGVSSGTDIDSKMGTFIENLATFFTDNASFNLVAKIAFWIDSLKDNYPDLSEDDLKIVGHFSILLMNCVGTCIAYYATTTKSTDSWSDLVQRAPGTIGSIIGTVATIGRIHLKNKRARIREQLPADPPPTDIDVFESWVLDPLDPVFEVPDYRQVIENPDSITDGEICLWENPEIYSFGRPYSDAAADGIEGAEHWMLGKGVEFAIGDTLRVAMHGLCAGLTFYSARYTFIHDKGAFGGLRALEVMDVAINGLALGAGAWNIFVRGGAVFCEGFGALAIPIVGEVLLALGAVIDILVTFFKALELTPLQKWVKDEGSKTMNSVTAPTSQWLLDHPMPDSQE